MNAAAWGVILSSAALVAIALQIRRLRSRQITILQFAGGMIARVGFLFLGILYAAGLVYRWPRAPLIGLGMVGAGIILNLTAGVIENIRRARVSPGESGQGDA